MIKGEPEVPVMFVLREPVVLAGRPSAKRLSERAGGQGALVRLSEALQAQGYPLELVVLPELLAGRRSVRQSGIGQKSSLVPARACLSVLPCGFLQWRFHRPSKDDFPWGRIPWGG